MTKQMQRPSSLLLLRSFSLSPPPLALYSPANVLLSRAIVFLCFCLVCPPSCDACFLRDADQRVSLPFPARASCFQGWSQATSPMARSPLSTHSLVHSLTLVSSRVSRRRASSDAAPNDALASTVQRLIRGKAKKGKRGRGYQEK